MLAVHIEVLKKSACVWQWWGARVLGPDASAAESGKGKIWVIK